MNPRPPTVCLQRLFQLQPIRHPRQAPLRYLQQLQYTTAPSSPPPPSHLPGAQNTTTAAAPSSLPSQSESESISLPHFPPPTPSNHQRPSSSIHARRKGAYVQSSLACFKGSPHALPIADQHLPDGSPRTRCAEPIPSACYTQHHSPQ